MDLLEGLREKASIRMVAQQRKAAQYFNLKVRLHSIQTRDWVLRNLNAARKQEGQGKLSPNWDGPFRVIRSPRAGAYYLTNSKGNQLPYSWNMQHLKKYF